jgi:hypothetical protein
MIEYLNKFNAWREEFEEIFGDIVGGSVGWLAGIIPAYFTFHHLQSVMGVPIWWSAVFGGIMALLEFAILTRFFQLYQYRRRGYKDTSGSVSPAVPGTAFAFYLIVVLLVNGVLAFFDSLPANGQSLSEAMFELVQQWNNNAYRVSRFVPAIVKTVVVFSLSLLSIIGAVVATIGIQQREYMERKHGSRTSSKPPSIPAAAQEEPPSTPKLSKRKKAFLKALAEDPKLLDDVQKFSEQLDVSRQTIYNYKEELLEAGYFKLTPTGRAYEVKM